MTPEQRAEIRAAARRTARHILATYGPPPRELCERVAALLQPTATAQVRQKAS